MGPPSGLRKGEALMSDLAIKNADRIARAIEGKIPKLKIYTRLHTHSAFQYVELGLQPNGEAHNEVQVAFSVDWFEDLNATNINVKANRVYKDAKIALGMEV